MTVPTWNEEKTGYAKQLYNLVVHYCNKINMKQLEPTDETYAEIGKSAVDFVQDNFRTIAKRLITSIPNESEGEFISRVIQETRNE